MSMHSGIPIYIWFDVIKIILNKKKITLKAYTIPFSLTHAGNHIYNPDSHILTLPALII